MDIEARHVSALLIRAQLDRDAFEATVGCTRLTADITNKACGPVLPLVQALVAAQRRDELTRQINTAEGQNNTAENKQDGAPAATSIDPQAETIPKLVAFVSFGRIKPNSDDIAMVRTIGFVATPSLAGVILMIASVLWAARTGQ